MRSERAGGCGTTTLLLRYGAMELVAQIRDKLGKASKALREQGLIPAELYGHGVKNLHLAVGVKEFKKVFKEAGENTVITLRVDKETRPALIHDVARDRLHDDVTHVDFYEVRMDQKITAHIPVEFVDEAPAVKNLGGILNKTMTEIEVEALPADLPHRFTVSLSPLVELNQSIYVKDLRPPKGVKILVAPGTVMVTVTPPLKEEVVEKPAEVSEVKVESEEKKIEREKEKEKDKEKEKPAA